MPQLTPCNMSQLSFFSLTMLTIFWTAVCGVPIDKARCPDGYNDGRFAELCFKLVRTPLSYTKATATCESDGGRLVTDKNRAKHNYLLKRDFAISYWIGLDDLKEDNRFVWSDGEELRDFAVFTKSYLKGKNADCVVLSRLTDMEWDPHDCEQTFAFVCQKELLWK